MTKQAKGFQKRIQRIEELTRKIEQAADPDLRASAKELLESVMELHGAGLERMVEIISQAGEPSQAIAKDLSRDELVSSLLVLYGLHPDDLETRVNRALEKLGPSLKSHNNEVELLGIEEGVVRLRLKASGGCGSHAANLKSETEQAIYEAAPDVSDIVSEMVEEPSSHTAFISLDKLFVKNGLPQL
jgi:Fe-S cluster biogenesis protein NfuA